MRRTIPTEMRELLNGRRVLVVEDEYMIAQEIAEVLSANGVEVVGPVPDVAAAMRLIALDGQIHGALLDVNLSSERIWPVVDKLMEGHVPLVLTTGYDASAIPRPYADLPRCEKPATGQKAVLSLAFAMAAAEPGSTG